MANIEDAPRLRELCEKASKEYDHEKLIELIRQINELLQNRRRGQDEAGKQASQFSGSASPMAYPEPGSGSLDLYWDDPASDGVVVGCRRCAVSARIFVLRWDAVPTAAAPFLGQL